MLAIILKFKSDVCSDIYKHFNWALIYSDLGSSARLRRFAFVRCVVSWRHYSVSVGACFSWGTKWGDGGYMKLLRDSRNLCGITIYSIFPKVGAPNPDSDSSGKSGAAPRLQQQQQQHTLLVAMTIICIFDLRVGYFI